MRPNVIAHYRIGEKLGQGGMGEVYQAVDTKLGRQVAIKFLPDSLAQDTAHMARFTREAQVLASLNHPNIAAIYGVEDRALIMELVEGPTLSDRIKSGPIPTEEALAIARQIADALEAAHAKGVVHRDLKPANIKITPGGTVKVLDFGLAKVAGTDAASIDSSPTMAATQAGIILGTAGYMAPEQARGREVDKRADVWAFGVVLYEMLTGTQLFQGDTVTDVMAAVVRQDPDWTKVPARVQPLLRRCLDKDPKRRLRDIGDAMLLLDITAEPSAAPAPSPTVWSRVGAAAAVVLLLAFAVVAFMYFRQRPPVAETVRFQLAYPQDLSPIGTAVFALSPDGRNLAYGAFGADGVPHIWLRPLDQVASRSLPGSELNRNTLALFWSPDSRYLAYWADQKLRRIDIAGGPAQVIAEAPMNVLGGSWNRDGVIIYSTGAGVMQVPAAGGSPTAVIKGVDANDTHWMPHFLPDGRHFLYLRGSTRGSAGVYIGSLDAKPEEQSKTMLLKTDYGATYAPRAGSDVSQLLFVRDGTLVTQPFDARRLELSGEPTLLADQVAALNFGLAYFSTSDSGTLVYFRAISQNVQLTWFSRNGQTSGTVGEPARMLVLKLSPDGTKAAVVRDDAGNNADIWQMDLAKGSATRFTFDAGLDIQPVWSSDGSRIAWVSTRNGFPGLYSKLANGSGNDELLYKFDAGQPPSLTDWTHDGRFLVYAYKSDVWVLPVSADSSGNRQPLMLVGGERGQLGAYVSPDLRWVAYMSNESGRQDLYVQPFAPGGSSAQGRPLAGKWMVSNGTLGMARWSADSRELLFLGTDGGVMAVEIAPGPVFKATPPQLLFRLPLVILTMAGNPGAIADVTRDHQRLLITMPIVDQFSGLNVVLNWQAERKNTE